MRTTIIGPEGRTDSAREPIQPNIREKPVPRENGFDVSCAVRPRTKFLYDPGSKTRRGVRQSKGERLGPSTLNPEITAFLLPPRPGAPQGSGSPPACERITPPRYGPPA